MTTPVLGEWIQFDLGTAKVIQTYGLGNGGADKEIGNWTLAGSTDNSTWYTIDTRTEATPAHDDFNTYTSAGPEAADSFRYIRLIVQGLTQQPYIMGSTLEFILYLQDSSGNFLQTSPTNTATFSQNLGNMTGSFRLSTSASDHYPWNEVGDGPSEPGYYYGTNDTYTGTVSTSITSGAPAPPVTTPALGGLYIKVVLPSAIGLGSYEFNTPLPYNTVPNHIVIYGNTDGSNNVYLVNDQATASNTVITTSNNAAYSTYYIVVNNLNSGSYANIKYIRFYNPTGGAITPSTVTMSSGWGTMNVSVGGSISDPMFFFTNTSGGNYIYMNVGSYYNGSFNGSFDNALMVITSPIRGNYWSFTLTSAASIASYGLGVYDTLMAIHKWALLGSNDNTTWDLIDTKNTVNTTDANTIAYTLSNPTALYSYVRLVFQSYTNGNASDSFFYRGGFWLKRADGSFITSSAGAPSSEFYSASFPTAQLATVTNTGSVGPNLVAGYGQSQTTALLGVYNGTGFAYTGTVSSTISSDPLPPPPTTANVFGSWFQMDFGSGKTMTSYGMLTDNPPYAPTSWVMTGSNDTVNWFQIGTRSGLSWSSYSQQNFAPTGAYSAMPYRYYRWIIRSIATSSIITPSIFFASDASGYIGWVGLGNCSISSDLSNGHTPNWTMNDAGNGWKNYFMASGYPSGAYSGSVSTTVIVPPSAPPAPTSLAASAGNGSVSISFTQGSDGGSAISNYKYSLNGGSSFTEFSPVDIASPVVISGLTNGVSYNIQLKAVNSLGDGDASASITVTPATIPDAPTDLVASYAGSGTVEISFTPGSNGGLTITNYQYSIDCGASFTPLNPVDGISPVSITGLTNGQAYCIELKAVNSVDAGIASSSVQYTPYGPADAPTSLTWVDTLNGTISLSFTQGSDQGSAITNYEYSLDGGNTFAPFSPAQTSSPVSISGLNIRTHYSIVLRAVNDAGGEESAVLNMYYMCFLEGTKILCFNAETNQEEYRAIETLRKGSLVKTVDDGYKAIDMIGTSKIYNPGNSVRSKNRLYKCSKENYPSLTEDLFITGCHSILVKDISDAERAELMEFQGKIYITDNHYRLIAAVDKRAEPHACEGVFNIWHMALENESYYFNYGIYANGLLVETSSLRMMKEISGMDLVQ